MRLADDNIESLKQMSESPNKKDYLRAALLALEKNDTNELFQIFGGKN